MKKITSLAFCLFMGSANAAVINFEDLAVSVGDNIIGGDRLSNSFLFNSSTDHTHLINNAHDSNSGSTFLVVDHGASVTNSLTMSNFNNNAPFSLVSFDLGEVGNGFATTISLVGNLVGGGTLNAAFNLDGIVSTGGSINFETFTLSGWTNLESVVFLATAGNGPAMFWGLDNINTTSASVPEPTTAALLALGLAGIGFSRKSKTT